MIPEVEEELFSLAFNDRELLLVFMEHTSVREFRQELDKLLLEDPGLGSLNNEQRRKLFTLMAQKGEGKNLEKILAEHPEWIETAWLALASVLASRGEHANACELARRFAVKPTLPQFQDSSSEEHLSKRMLSI